MHAVAIIGRLEVTEVLPAHGDARYVARLGELDIAEWIHDLGVDGAAIKITVEPASRIERRIG